jgi:hypothetical protein
MRTHQPSCRYHKASTLKLVKHGIPLEIVQSLPVGTQVEVLEWDANRAIDGILQDLEVLGSHHLPHKGMHNNEEKRNKAVKVS